jgi:hypothetical protein
VLKDFFFNREDAKSQRTEDPEYVPLRLCGDILLLRHFRKMPHYMQSRSGLNIRNEDPGFTIRINTKSYIAPFRIFPDIILLSNIARI